MDKSTSFSKKRELNCRGKILTLDQPVVMGILNITPDSFYDGKMYESTGEVIKQTEKMIKEGASIIDVGAVSTRPGAHEVSEDEEISRLDPVISMLVKQFPDIIISVDTYRSAIAKWAIDLGAGMINDISGGTFDESILELIPEYDIAYVLMHIKGKPENMQTNPEYDNIVDNIMDFFNGQIRKLNKNKFYNIILDPGFGFGKTLDHNYTLLKHLNEFKIPGYPVMAGVSRKSMINKVLKTKPARALNGTTILNTIALLNGADILRVHDVKEAMEVIRIVEQYKNIE